jgi:hypothetical protein
MLRGDEEKI